MQSEITITKKNTLESNMVSIIIPAFNVEKDISRCLDSIINQTYKNIEVIIVNDASTDKTRNIIDEYIQKDVRIICIDKTENKGLLQARMTGIALAKGKYIYSVDSDDYVMHDLVEDTLQEALKHNADIVQFPMKLASEDSKYTYNWTMREYQEYDKNNFFLQNGNSWTIMFKKELGDVLIKYIGSLSVNYHEDYIISIILSAFYKKVRYIDTAYYVYCDTDTSMTRQYSDEAILKYVRDTLIFTKFMTDLVPIIFPKENSDYLFTTVSNRIRLMKKQLKSYFKESKNVSIYNLYNETDKNETFIMNSMLYEAIRIKDHQLKQQTQELRQRAQKINQQTQELQQRAQKINQQTQELQQRAQKINQQTQELQLRYQQINQLQSQNKALLDNRWYHFGQMSNKRKIWAIGEVVSKKIKLYWLLQPIAKLINKILGK